MEEKNYKIIKVCFISRPMVQCLALYVGHRSSDSIVFPNKHSLAVSCACSYSMPTVSIVRDSFLVACVEIMNKEKFE